MVSCAMYIWPAVDRFRAHEMYIKAPWWFSAHQCGSARVKSHQIIVLPAWATTAYVKDCPGICTDEFWLQVAHI